MVSQTKVYLLLLVIMYLSLLSLKTLSADGSFNHDHLFLIYALSLLLTNGCHGIQTLTQKPWNNHIKFF